MIELVYSFFRDGHDDLREVGSVWRAALPPRFDRLLRNTDMGTNYDGETFFSWYGFVDRRPVALYWSDAEPVVLDDGFVLPDISVLGESADVIDLIIIALWERSALVA
jgi:hypothetical protein